ncbi:unnamed protein product [Plutella xylostella]|uniref:Chromatin-remodeling ATPase INO80 n=1 Tax=Plutella xylostella TaxID=51655 RepID=A0A8S4DPV0_PLUXY|nr:unnamed protein product [Plutella xylostella]
MMLDVLEPYLALRRHRYLRLDGSTAVQFTMMLDVLEPYLALRRHRYLRLDGSTAVTDRYSSP